MSCFVCSCYCCFRPYSVCCFWRRRRGQLWGAQQPVAMRLHALLPGNQVTPRFWLLFVMGVLICVGLCCDVLHLNSVCMFWSLFFAAPTPPLSEPLRSDPLSHCWCVLSSWPSSLCLFLFSLSLSLLMCFVLYFRARRRASPRLPAPARPTASSPPEEDSPRKQQNSVLFCFVCSHPLFVRYAKQQSLLFVLLLHCFV